MNIKLVLGILSAIALTPLILGNMLGNAHTPSPQPTATPSTAGTTNPDTQFKGLIEEFKVTTAGKPLPPQPAGAVLPGKAILQPSRDHVDIGTKIPYNSNPPTSGPHYPKVATWGIYKQAPADGFLVHNLEHGGIIISYNPNRIKGKELEKLRSQARELSAINPRLVLTPRANLDAAIALTSWGYLQKINSYAPAAVKAFYNAHIARGAECEKGLCPS